MKDKIDSLFTFDYEYDEKFGTYTFATTPTNATGTSDVRGSSATTYNLLPTKWLQTVVDAAKAELKYANVAYQAVAPKGSNDVVIPYRTKYKGASGFTFNTAENDSGTYTTIDTPEGLRITPAHKDIRVALSYDAIRTNAVEMVRYVKEEMQYGIAEYIDNLVRDAIENATEATDSAMGAQVIYGGDATSTATLEAGDTISVDLIAKAVRLLKSKDQYYWNSGTFTKSSVSKNPWARDDKEPFVLFVSEYQAETLMKDSNFIDASKYGGREVILTGEIGKIDYLGVKIVETPNVPAYTNWGAGSDIAGHSCHLVKAKKAVALGFGQKPIFRVVDKPDYLQKRFLFDMSVAANAFYPDAIVKIKVTDA